VKMTPVESEMVLLNVGGGIYELQGWRVPEKKPEGTSQKSKSTPEDKIQVRRGNSGNEKGMIRK
jgi:hypothetical protein